MATLRIIINILNLGIDHDMKQGNVHLAKQKMQARDKILQQLINKASE